MSGLRYPTSNKQGIIGPDQWHVNMNSGRSNTIEVITKCGISSRTSMGSQDIYGAKCRSLMNQFDGKYVVQRFPEIFN